VRFIIEVLSLSVYLCPEMSGILGILRIFHHFDTFYPQCDLFYIAKGLYYPDNGAFLAGYD
jgi:hypothetical protein